MRDLSGQTFGSYRLEGLLGRGGMGEVYRAQHLRLNGRLAAVKILPASFASDPDFLRRFDQEANSAASLDHPNILPVWDYGEQDGTPYLAMPLVSAGSLKELLERRGPLSPTEAERYLAPIAEALDYAHSRGILHRDVKPANILLREDGRPQLADFGIAKAIEAGQTQGLTQAGRGIGTPEYMAPEQIEGRAEPRSDVYALGIALYQMLSGQLPYDGSTPYEVALKQISTPLPSLRRLRPDISPAIEATVARALAKDPAARYPTGRAFAAAFHQAVTDPKTVPTPVPGIYDQRTRPLPVAPTQDAQGRAGIMPPASPAPAVASYPVVPPSREAARRNSSWPLIAAALILAVLIVGVGGAYAFGLLGAPPPPTPTRPIAVAPSVDPTLTAVAAINATTVAGINSTATVSAVQGATATANADAAQANATASAVAAEGATATAVEGAAATARAASSATARAAAAATESANATANAAANAAATANANAAASATARAATPVRTPTATAPPPTNTAVPPTSTVPPPTVAPTVAPTRAPSTGPTAAPTQANGAAWGPALAPLSGGKRYTDPANRFSFSVPNSWVQAQNTNDQAIFVPADNSSTFTASLSPVSGTTTLDNLDTAVEQQTRGQLSGYAAVSLDRVLIDGHQAYRRVSRGKVQGQNVQLLQLYFVDKAVAHLLTFVAKVENFDRLAATFDGVGGSYRVGP